MSRLSRREFLRGAVVALGAAPVLLATACGPQPTPVAPTAAPTKPATPDKPAAPAAPTPAAKVEERLGKTLLYPTPEASEVILDSAKWPKKFSEAPMLAELVKAGKLPPVEQRLPAEPLVMKPVHEIGKYGGILRRGFTGPGDVINGYRTASGPDLPLYLGPDLKTILPNVAKGYQMSDGDRVFTLFLRKGMKWSDGAPFTADDYLFWFEDLYQTKDLVPTPDARMSIGGKPGKLEKVDALTVRWVFPDPYPYFPKVMSLFNPLSSHAQYGNVGMGSVAPAHYLKQFHPKYTPKDELDKKVKEGGFDNWVSMFKFKNNWALNPDLPTLCPWKTVSPANKSIWSFERNPYSIWVDTEGNQLPYIDRIVMTLAETTELLNLRAIAGEIDMQARHIDIAKIPVLLENQQKGDYKVSLNPGTWGADYGIWINQSYEADPEIQKWLGTVDFRRALALGIDREQINETFFLGIGVAGSAAPAENNPYNPGPEYRKLWATHDPKKANEMLDKLGLDKKDAEGFRLRADGKGRLTLQVTTVAAAPIQYTVISEMVRQHWQKIGIDLQVQENERSLASKRNDANECQMYTWLNDSSDEPIAEPTYNFPNTPGSQSGPLYGRWFASGGKQGKEPPASIKKVGEMWRKAMGVPEAEAIALVKDMWKVLLDEVWYIGVVGQSGAMEGIQVTKNKLGNVPRRWLHLNRQFSPAVTRPICFYWKG